MHPIIYDVAVSLDGFICGPDQDVSLFAHSGPVVDDYNRRLASYGTALMGRATYEFGFRYGLEPGQNPYPHMTTYVVSKTLERSENSAVEIVRRLTDDTLARIVRSAAAPIYLCGGGAFAGALLKRKAIDRVVLKRAPIVLGGGVSLFGSSGGSRALRRTGSKAYDNGYVLEEYVPADTP